MASFDINVGKQRIVPVVFTKADGTAGTVDGIPMWMLSDPSMADLHVSDDGMTATVAHSKGSGMVTLSMDADGDLGAGVFPIHSTVDFDMKAPLGAVAGGLTVGDEMDIPVV